jgi:hypothetical protein
MFVFYVCLVAVVSLKMSEWSAFKMKELLLIELLTLLAKEFERTRVVLGLIFQMSDLQFLRQDSVAAS